MAVPPSELPGSLIQIYCGENQLKRLPPLPVKLTDVIYDDNPWEQEWLDEISQTMGADDWGDGLGPGDEIPQGWLLAWSSEHRSRSRRVKAAGKR